MLAALVRRRLPTEDDVRAFQLATGLVVSGVLDELTVAVWNATSIDIVPEWFDTPDQDDVVVSCLGDTDAVRRFQSALGLEPTGVVDETTARHIGERA